MAKRGNDAIVTREVLDEAVNAILEGIIIY
jgi:hypothetical protein